MTKNPIIELSASEITKSALKELAYRNCFVWRQNQIPVRGRAFTGQKGLSDICGFNKGTGQAVFVEIKKIGDTLKPDQREFLTAAKTAGCCVLIACQENNQVVLKEYM